MPVDAKEIAVGLVLHLDASALRNNGATCTCGSDLQVKGGHFFLCIGRSKGESRWVPLYTKDGKGRTPVSKDGRSGHEKWVNGTFHWHADQVWTVGDPGVVAAARAGKDQSRARQRNTLDAAEVPKV